MAPIAFIETKPRQEIQLGPIILFPEKYKVITHSVEDAERLKQLSREAYNKDVDVNFSCDEIEREDNGGDHAIQIMSEEFGRDHTYDACIQINDIKRTKIVPLDEYEQVFVDRFQ